MAAPRLNKAQQEILLQWVAEGLQSDEINRRAAEFEPPFSISRDTVKHYRKTRAVAIKEITQAAEHAALTTGLANKSIRVEKLKKLAQLIENDLFGDSLWVTDVKTAGTELVHVEKPNAVWVSAYQKLLEQIAEEVGDKKPDALPVTEVRVTFVKPPEGQQ